MISRFQYLTQDNVTLSHEELVLIACKAGIQWIQLRMKIGSESDKIRIAQNVIKICRDYQVKLIINDAVEISALIDADGVHLGKNDLSITKARAILGNKKMIGGTANTMEDIERLNREGVDYIGVGPFRFTATKAHLSPILGLQGYKTLVEQCSNRQLNIPLIAIGGITIKDVQPILLTGMYGIAVSSAINMANDKKEQINIFGKMVESSAVSYNTSTN